MHELRRVRGLTHEMNQQQNHDGARVENYPLVLAPPCTFLSTFVRVFGFSFLRIGAKRLVFDFKSSHRMDRPSFSAPPI